MNKALLVAALASEGAFAAILNHDSHSLVPKQGRTVWSAGSSTCFAPTANGTEQPTQFVAFKPPVLNKRTALIGGSEDYVIDHVQGLPEPSSLSHQESDEDAIELFKQLRALSGRPVINISDVSIVGRAPEYGAGAMVHMVIYPVLEALVEKRTLFAPQLRLWAPKECPAQDGSCYLDALPSLSSYYYDPKKAVLRHKDLGGHPGYPNNGRAPGGTAPVTGDGTGSLPAKRVDDDDDDDDDDDNEAKIRNGGNSKIVPQKPDEDDEWDEDDDDEMGLKPDDQEHQPLDADAHAKKGDGDDDDDVEEKASPPPLPGVTYSPLPAATAKLIDNDALKSNIEHSGPKKGSAHGMDMDWLMKKQRHVETPLEKELHAACAKQPDCKLRTLDLLGKVDKRGGHFFEHYDEAALFSKLPYRFRRHGRFWLVSQVLHFVTRPNARLQKELDDARRRLAIGYPSLSVHIRKGDACTARHDCRNLTTYMPKIDQMVQRYGMKTVFLSTPSADVIEDTVNYPHLTFKYMPVTPTTALMKKHKILQIEEGLASGVVDAGVEFRAYMVDMYLLAQGSAFLGGFSSNAARLAYSLMSAGTEGCLKPFLSADINWCFAFGKNGNDIIRYADKRCSDVYGCSKTHAHLLGC